MTSRQYFYVLLSVAVLLFLGLFGVAYGADVVLSNKAEELGQLKAESQTIDGLQANLTRNKSDLVRYKDLNEIAKMIVPQDKDQTQTVREIVKIAQASGINNLSSITFPSSTLGGVGKKTAITQVTPVPGMAGVYAMPITVTVNADNAVTFQQLVSFLKGLEQNRRTAQVNSLTLQPNSDDPNVMTFSVVINEYIKP